MVLITYTPLLCANLSGPPKHSHFLIPLIETLHLVIRTYCIEGFLLASKLSEKISRVDPSLAGGYISASTTRKKKGSSYPSCINASICVLKMLYWQNTDITKTGRDMMVCRIGFSFGHRWTHMSKKLHYLLISLKCTWNKFLTAFLGLQFFFFVFLGSQIGSCTKVLVVVCKWLAP